MKLPFFGGKKPTTVPATATEVSIPKRNRPPLLKTRPLPRSQPELPALFGNTNSLVCCVLCFLNFVPRAAPARSRGR